MLYNLMYLLLLCNHYLLDCFLFQNRMILLKLHLDNLMSLFELYSPHHSLLLLFILVVLHRYSLSQHLYIPSFFMRYRLSLLHMFRYMLLLHNFIILHLSVIMYLYYSIMSLLLFSLLVCLMLDCMSNFHILDPLYPTYMFHSLSSNFTHYHTHIRISILFTLYYLLCLYYLCTVFHLTNMLIMSHSYLYSNNT